MDEQSWITSQEAFELGFSTTMTRTKEAQQALEANYIFNLVSQIKDLQKELDNSRLNNKITEKPKDAWASFFSIKN